MVKIVESKEEFEALKTGDKPVPGHSRDRARRARDLARVARLASPSNTALAPLGAFKHARDANKRRGPIERSPRLAHARRLRPSVHSIHRAKLVAQVLVDFTASWCGPCKMIAPFFEELAAKYPGVVFVKVDVDDLDDVAAECGISAMPTFQLYSNGVKVQELTGADKDKLEALAKSADDL
ncbi:uncharacterized protein MICPUCDRAFT_50406 [Micromonas pusilla CCMP1545]|uniref:Predicted protein n=1 Tax=Micromonas pusilla (strain CCMP1545) TaxID=564608 RepID=C1MI23_MICPC|nr:uncharacterized protein MICPUCDRAFT_50406 [Micromonas pusilla CCMP1545]EEH60844.1 predicted protein [Micromonas pusilla CCMP1545]|eukprot:XP_003055592.1 predicted protein [Micromonas pusilla CCMP1545]